MNLIHTAVCMHYNVSVYTCKHIYIHTSIHTGRNTHLYVYTCMYIYIQKAGVLVIHGAGVVSRATRSVVV